MTFDLHIVHRRQLTVGIVPGVVVHGDAIGRGSSFAGWQVGPENGVVEGIEVNPHRVVALVVEPYLGGKERSHIENG